MTDETLQSVVARFLDQFPKANHPQIVRRLLGGPNHAIAVDFPHQLDRICSVLGLEVNATIERHTLLPIYRPFIRSEASIRAEAAMRANGNPHFILGIGPHRGCVSRGLRLCPQCSVADTARSGTPAWRRIHQMKSVFICPDHGISLIETSARSRPVFLFEFSAARTATTEYHGAFTPYLHSQLAWIAQSLRQLLIIHDCPLPGPKRLSDYYYECLAKRGFVLTNGRIAHTALMESFAGTFSEELLRTLDCSIILEARDNWVRRLVAQNPGHQAPHRHLLMMHFLEEHPLTALRDAMLAVRRLQPALLRPQFAAPSHTVKRAKRAEWRQALRSGVQNLRTSHDALYSWMWRHDRKYLLASKQKRTRPVIRRRDWAAIDREMVDKILRAASVLRRNGQRASWTRLAIASGRPSLLVARHPMIPRTLAAIGEMAQTAESHAIIRIKAAIANLAAKASDLAGWRIAKVAGIGSEMRARPTIRHLLQNPQGSKDT